MPIVQAVGVACGRVDAQNDQTRSIAKAMLEAVQKAQAEGITDDDIIRQRILEARDKAVSEG